MTFWTFTEYQNDPAGCISGLRSELQGLGEVHYNLLRYLIRFLVVVAQYERTNKMSPMSLAIVFGPNLFRYWQVFCWLCYIIMQGSQLNKVRNIFFMIDNLIFCERLWFDFDSVSTEIHWDTFIEMWMYLFYLWLGLIHCNYWGHFFQMWPGSHRIEGPGENQSNCVQVHHQLWCSVQGGEWNLTMRWMGK